MNKIENGTYGKQAADFCNIPEKKQEIPVFFTIDDSYAPYLAVALTSLMENASSDYIYKIYVIYQELNEENRGRISRMGRDGFDIELVPMQKGLDDIRDRTENRLRCDYFTLTIYFRLFLADMFPQYDKGIYIDSDIVVPGDISKMFEIELGDNIVGACPDFSIQEIPPLVNWVENAVGVPKAEYINSGVLLMNLKKMREVRLSKHFLGLLNRFHFDCLAPDQDYLNAMCHGKICYLPECWDVMPNKAKPPVEQPQLIHYNLYDKPWCYDDVMYEAYFWKYAWMTEYYDDIVRAKENYSEEQKQSDNECRNRMAEKGAVGDRPDVTFRKMYERGEKIRV
ncbi:MAG: glycosyltransferase family 8 protein [Lachnospiraceae bacterium]|nr:glycosyltransferase family 8 protein [Lachnospiraceae bacterium]